MSSILGRACLCVVLTVLGGCTTSEDGAPPPSSATPSDAGVHEVTGDGTALPPGRYTLSAFQPGVTFTLGEGFVGGHTNPEFFDVFKGDGALAFASPGYLLDSKGSRIPAASLTPSRAIDVLRARGALDRVTSSTVTIGDQQAPTLEGVVRESGTKVLGGPGGELGLEGGDLYRFAALRVQDRLVLVIQQALEAPFAPALATTDPVLPTISFE